MASRKSSTPSSSSGKSNEAEIEVRVLTVLKQLTEGKSRAWIVQDGSKKWEITERQVDDYIAAAKKTILEKVEKNRDAHISMALFRMELVFDKALEKEDYQGAISAQREINKIMGIYAPVNANINLTAYVKAYQGFNPDEWSEDDSEPHASEGS